MHTHVHPINVVRIRTNVNAGSMDVWTSLYLGQTHPMQIRSCFGGAPEMPRALHRTGMGLGAYFYLPVSDGRRRTERGRCPGSRQLQPDPHRYQQRDWCLCMPPIAHRSWLMLRHRVYTYTHAHMHTHTHLLTYTRTSLCTHAYNGSTGAQGSSVRKSGVRVSCTLQASVTHVS